MKHEAIQLLKRLTEAHGCSGFENHVQKLIAKELKENLTTDNFGGIIHTISGTSDRPSIMVAAHMDEVGFMVQSITADGFIKFVELGGWWSHTLLAQRVRILTHQGTEIIGVVASKPPHFLKADEREKVIKIEHMYIDIGAQNKEEVIHDFGINLGDSIVPHSEFLEMHNNDYLLAKAFDDRIGIALMIQVAKCIAELSHPNTVKVVGTTQEEVGVRGATIAVQTINPDLAIVLEGTPADDTPNNTIDEAQGILGKGPQIRLMDSTAIMNKGFTQLAIQVAQENSIPYQVAVRRRGGTDAKAIHTHGSGIPTIVIGTPVRYIHTHNGILHIEDYLNTLRLTAELIKRLDENTAHTFTQFMSN